MKKKIFFIIFIITWGVLIVLNFIIPKQRFSAQENRYLSSIPNFSWEDLVDGIYAKRLDDYINDHFIARNFWLKLNSFVQLSTGKTENNGVYIGKNGYLFEKFEYGDEGIENLQKTSNAINKFSKNINIPIYFLLAPNSIYINKDKLPEHVSVYDQSKIIDNFYKTLNNNIIKINVVDMLKSKKEAQLYFKTDHHMTSYGAYLIYLKFCESAKLNAVQLTNFEKEIKTREFLGTFDSKAQVINQEPDEIIAFKNDINQNIKGNYDGIEYNSIFNEAYLNKKDKYSYFLNGNSSKAVIKTNVNNGKKLLVIKDSYAHIVAQFLCQNYEEIHFIDCRYYKYPITEYIQQNEITEVLFMYNVSNIIEDTSLKTIT